MTAAMIANSENVWSCVDVVSFIDGVGRDSGRDVVKSESATQNTAISVQFGRVIRVIVYIDIARGSIRSEWS